MLSAHRAQPVLVAVLATVGHAVSVDHLVSLVLLALLVCLAHPDPSQIFNHSSTKSSSHRAVRKAHHQTHLPTCRHRLDQLDQEDQQVCVVHLAHKALWDHKETLVIQDHLDPLV